MERRPRLTSRVGNGQWSDLKGLNSLSNISSSAHILEFVSRGSWEY